MTNEFHFAPIPLGFCCSSRGGTMLVAHPPRNKRCGAQAGFPTDNVRVMFSAYEQTLHAGTKGSRSARGRARSRRAEGSRIFRSWGPETSETSGPNSPEPRTRLRRPFAPPPPGQPEENRKASASFVRVPMYGPAAANPMATANIGTFRRRWPAGSGAGPRQRPFRKA